MTKDFPILNMNSPTFAKDFADATGIKPGDAIRIMTPQFERIDGLKPVENPSDLFKSIHTLSKETLKTIGLQAWGEMGLWLFPYQWYDFIPEGFVLRCISGDDEPFEKGKTDDDMRFGALAYGIIPDFEKVTIP